MDMQMSEGDKKTELMCDNLNTSDFWKSHDANYDGNMRQKLFQLSRNGPSNEFVKIIDEDMSTSIYTIDLDMADADGWTPLIHASFNGLVEIVEHIMTYQEKKYKLQFGEELASGKGSQLKWKSEFQKFLCSKVHNNGSSALHLACARGHEAVVELFMDKMLRDLQMAPHECINDSDFDLATPLHCAVLGKHYNICKILLENHASITQSDIRGKTALDWAKERGLTDYVALLEQHGRGSADDMSKECMWLLYTCVVIVLYVLKTIYKTAKIVENIWNEEERKLTESLAASQEPIIDDDAHLGPELLDMDTLWNALPEDKENRDPRYGHQCVPPPVTPNNHNGQMQWANNQTLSVEIPPNDVNNYYNHPPGFQAPPNSCRELQHHQFNYQQPPNGNQQSNVFRFDDYHNHMNQSPMPAPVQSPGWQINRGHQNQWQYANNQHSHQQHQPNKNVNRNNGSYHGGYRGIRQRAPRHCRYENEMNNHHHQQQYNDNRYRSQTPRVAPMGNGGAPAPVPLAKAQSWDHHNHRQPPRYQSSQQPKLRSQAPLEIDYAVPSQNNAHSADKEAKVKQEKDNKSAADQESEHKKETEEDELVLKNIENIEKLVIEGNEEDDPAFDALKFQNKYLKARCDSLEKQNQEIVDQYQEMKQNEKNWITREEELMEQLEAKENHILELEVTLKRIGNGWNYPQLKKQRVNKLKENSAGTPRNDRKKTRKHRKKKVDPLLKYKQNGKKDSSNLSPEEIDRAWKKRR